MSWFDGVKYAEECYCGGRIGAYEEKEIIDDARDMANVFGDGILDYIEYLHEVLDNL